MVSVGLSHLFPLHKDYASVLEDHLDLVDRVVAFVARRHGLDARENEELGARVRLKLVERDYEVLRRYEGRSALNTYLVTVVQSVCMDYRDEYLGKWRPSRAARRLGETAVRLERWMVREGLSPDEAVDRVAADQQVDRETLVRLAGRLPRRGPRRVYQEADLDALPAREVGGERQMIWAQQESARRDLETALTRALREKPAEDQLLVKMHFHESLKVSQISRMLGLDQKKLYRRMERLLATIRGRLEAQGFSQQAVQDLLQ